MSVRDDAPDEAGYGSALRSLWRRDIRDRMRGDSARANARWGFLTPPRGDAKLVWVHTAADYASTRIGVELVRALRDKRQDIRIALTFERDQPELLAKLAGLTKVGYGFGPCDRPRAVARVLKRFEPLGILHVGQAPRPRLSAAAHARRIRTVAVNAPPRGDSRVEVCYPRTENEAAQWRTANAANEIAAPASLLTLVVEAQVDPNFRAVVTGGADLSLRWLHGVAPAEYDEVLTRWRALTEHVPGILFIGPAQPAALAPLCARKNLPCVGLAQWPRSALAAGSVVAVDDARWLPAIAASAQTIHLQTADASVFWQALASGAAVSFARAEIVDAHLGRALQARIVADYATLFAQWAQATHEPLALRKQGDELRRSFWHERRRAATAVAELLQRVYDW